MPEQQPRIASGESARHEASELVGMVRRGAMTLDDARTLIAVPDATRERLVEWARVMPAHVRGIRRIDGHHTPGFSAADLRWRAAVSRCFERLVATRVEGG